MFRPTDELSDVRWLPVLNTSGEEIPSYGVMRVTGKDTDTGMTKVDQPDADDMNAARLLINGPGVIAIDEAGTGTRDYPIMALVAGDNSGSGSGSGGTTGDTAGTVVGEWALAVGGGGFVLWTDVEDGKAVVVSDAGATGDRPLARVVGDGPVDRLCGPGWGSGDLSCPNFLDPPAGPIYDADLVTPPRRVRHPTLVDVMVYTDFEAVKPIWLLQPNGGRWPFGVLPRDNIYLTRRLVAEAVCVCGETRPMYVTDDAGAAQVSGFWAILTDSPCGSGSGGCNRTGYGWILATTDGAGNWTPFAGVSTLGATYGTTTDYPALEVNHRLPTLSADPPTVVWLRPTPGANPDCPTFSFEWQSAPAACPGACVRTREVTFSYTKDDGMGGCCTETTTITLPVDVDVCVTPCGGSGGSGG
jgi:hypothetical protein